MEESKENWALEPGSAVPVQSSTAFAVSVFFLSVWRCLLPDSW